MTDLAAIVRATRASANALAAMAREKRAMVECSRLGVSYLPHVKAYNRAEARYNRAQDILRANPLPSDDVSMRD